MYMLHVSMLKLTYMTLSHVFLPFSFCRVLSRMHESMTDLRKLVAETQVQRPKTDMTGGIVDGFDPQTDVHERRGKHDKIITPHAQCPNKSWKWKEYFSNTY